MARLCLFLLICVACSATAFSQVGINTITPNPSAALDVTSGDKGMLIPRMDSASRAAIASPATGLLIYQTNGVTPGFFFYNGSAWTELNTASEPSYGYYYNTSGTIAISGGSVFFTNAGETSNDLIFTGTDVIVTIAGVYEISYTVIPSIGNRSFGITANGMLLPGSAFGTSTAGTPIVGQVVATLNPGDDISLVNTSSNAFLNSLLGTTNSSLLIRRLK